VCKLLLTGAVVVHAPDFFAAAARAYKKDLALRNALDAAAEHALFERYASSASAAARTLGGITVLVSHRFSTVLMADMIAVLDHGRLAEYGTHDELLARGGLYAELFQLQARAYR